MEEEILLVSQIDALVENLERVQEIVRSERIDRRYVQPVYGKFSAVSTPLKSRLDELKTRVSDAALMPDQAAQAWQSYAALKQDSQRVFAQCLDFLGGVALRRMDLDGGICELAERLVADYANRTGVNWSSVVILGGERLYDGPSHRIQLIRLPFPSDVWSLPFTAHEFGRLVAMSGDADGSETPRELLRREQRRLHESIEARDEPVEEIEATAPGLRLLHRAYHAGRAGAPVVEQFLIWQQTRMLGLFADVFATYFLGPAYVHALLFLTLDPTQPRGEEGQDDGDGFAIDAQRAAVVLQTLTAMDTRSRTAANADPYTEGPFASELRLLETVWQDALRLCGAQQRYAEIATAMQPWGERAFAILNYWYGEIAMTADLWKQAEHLITALRGDVDPAPERPDPTAVLNAAWWCRARYPERCAEIDDACRRLLRGERPRFGLPSGVPAAPDGVTRLLQQRLYSLRSQVPLLRDVIATESIELADRRAVSGRFLRLLSQQEYRYDRLQRYIGAGAPSAQALRGVIAQARGAGMRSVRREALEFLGGVFIRQVELDGGLCRIADALLRDYAALTGVNWMARSIPGQDPLFSGGTRIIHLRFLDMEIWNLPLMAHEFGHVTATDTPEYQEWYAHELLACAQGHPDAASWDARQTESYRQIRGSHLHEFFADAFAVYCQGPSFAYDAVLLHFDPLQAYAPQGDHPTHAERVEIILAVLKGMNDQERRDAYDQEPYHDVVARLRDWWDRAIQRVGVQPESATVYEFHKRQAITIAEALLERVLRRYFEFGAWYRGDDWTRAGQVARRLLDDEPDLSRESLRDLLNIAWACRIQFPAREADIARRMRAACEQYLSASSHSASVAH